MYKTNTIELLRKTIDEISDIMLQIYIDWKRSQTETPSDCECMAESMYQMMVCKAKNVLLMSNGIALLSEPKVIISDPSTIYPVVRSMLEMNFIFRCIYASSNNDTERELLFKIWKIRGNNNLIKIPKAQLDKKQQEIQLEKSKENDTLKEDIRKLMCKLSLSNSTRNSIEKTIKDDYPNLKGFKFNHPEQSDSISSFSELSLSESSKEFTPLSFVYAHFSAHSHPSYLGVEHFWKMYNLNGEDNFIIEELHDTCCLLGYFMMDFYKYKESYRPFYNKRESDIGAALNVFDESPRKS